MRTAIFTCLFAVFGNIANAQFTLLPQVSLEDPRTSVKYNDQHSFSPLCVKPAPQVSLRLDYLINQMHGPWISAGSSRHIVTYRFANPETGMENYTAAKENTQLRLEAGYQLKTKPLFLDRKSDAKSSANQYKGHCQRQTEARSCGSKPRSPAASAKKTSKRNWLKLVPSAGIAYIPFAPGSGIESKTSAAGTEYIYNAGNWSTAFVGGLGVEFGRNNRSHLNLSLNYLKGFGNNLSTKNMTTVSGNKITNTSLSSSSSAWNVKLGIPISLAKKKSEVKEPVAEKVYIRETRKCGTEKIQYKPRCYKSYSEQ